MDFDENIYPQSDIVEIAGASVLRTALVMRDKWKRMFTSRLNSRGFTNEDVPDFLGRLVMCCPQSRENNTQSIIQLYFASTSEIMMYFDLEKVDIDFSKFLLSISLYIYGMMIMNEDNCETFEDLFDTFDDVSEYMEWITDFMVQFAIPYGSRDDVSDLFFRRVRKRFQDQVAELVNKNRFLPYDLFGALSDNLENYPQTTSTPKDGESPGPSELPTGSEPHAPQRTSKSLSTQSENVPEHSGQGGEISSELGIEQELDKMCLGAEGISQKIHGAIPKHKSTQNKDAGSCPFLAKFSSDKS